jgi:hypothetical protein
MINALLLVLAVTSGKPLGSDGGEIWIRSAPGVVVTLDGVRAGVTTEADAGLRISGVSPGVHELGLAMPGGGSRTVTVEVSRGESTTVNVPLVGLQPRRPASAGALLIEALPYRQPCQVTVGAARYDLTAATLRIDKLPGGRHPVTVTCGGRSLRQEVEVEPTRLIDLRFDITRNRLDVIRSRPREAVTELTSRDRIESAAIAEVARKALFSSLVADVEVVALESRDGSRTAVTFASDSDVSLAAQAESLRQIVGVTIVRTKRNHDGQRLTLTLLFTTH